MPVASGVLIVDDSALTREALRKTLESDVGLKVVGEARTGEEAIELTRTLKPSLVTMDLNMPGMGGLKAIEAIMRDYPTPIVVISERSSSAGFDVNAEALSRGALELIPKSSVFGVSEASIRHFAERMKALSNIAVRARGKPRQAATSFGPSKELPQVVGIGASTGGPKALVKVLSEIPSDFPLPIVVVQHMADDFFESFVRFLADATKKTVQVGAAGKVVQAGVITVAPSRFELFVLHDLSVKLTPAPAQAVISPTVDSLFFSLASSFQARSIGVLLTGMGDDGAQGLLRMRRAGARTIVQDRATSIVYGMPKVAVEVGAAEVVAPLESIAEYINRAAGTAVEAASTRVIAVIDSSESEGAEVRNSLEKTGFMVRVFTNPLTAASEIRRGAIDLVLLETELETVTTASVLSALKGSQIPVFLMSKTEVTPQDQVKALGAAGAVRKAGRTLAAEVSAFLGGVKRR